VIVGAAGTTGFDAYPLVDPAIVGDASGNGGASLSAFDTSLIAQESAGINTPEVPDGTAQGSGGSALYDPQLSIPDNIPVVPGNTYELPVNITIEPAVVGIISSTYTVRYRTDDLDFLGASNGSDFPAPGWIMTVSEQVPGTIKVSIFNTFPSGNNGGVPLQLGKLNFLVLPAANLGISPLQIDPVDPHESGLVWTKDDGSVQIAHLQGDYNGNGAVDGADYVVWRKLSSTGGTGGANETGYTIWRENFGASLPGAGAGATMASTGSAMAGTGAAIPPSASTGAAMASASLSDSGPISQSNSTDASPVAPRVEVLAGFALGPGSADSRTTPTARNRLSVSPSNITEVSPAAARDEVLAGFGLGIRSANSRTTRTAPTRLPEQPQLSDGNLLNAVTNEKRKYDADKYDSLSDDNRIDHTDAVDELLSDLDCELTKMI
jgi:hypothetical protein